ncbi:CDK2-associated and cullin domain-containing protein 1 isoform X3 [Hypanus sabinus]|uniref:CDK2-associated and cullin domain-containing protein 1 isoform X3 n=1 Tax=Hypanus sabinus TaxID=79690 RepID=UPI0028C4BFC9|nr:CDK2-associated and cullin domain-containing protein 1 isoform X3 [Hypanus sabinus]
MDENMEEDASYQQLVMDDHNHNNWEADAYQHHHNHQHHNGHRHTELILPEPGSMSQAQQDPKELHHHHLSVNGEERGPGAHREPEPMTNKVTLNINSSASKFLMNVITAEDYQRTYWPKLDSAIDQLLTQSPGDCIPISYEQIYSCVYKCVCQQHSEQMYCDLITKITSHLRRISEELQVSCPDAYIERFNAALSQYMGALQSIVPLFIYMTDSGTELVRNPGTACKLSAQGKICGIQVWQPRPVSENWYYLQRAILNEVGGGISNGNSSTVCKTLLHTKQNPIV